MRKRNWFNIPFVLIYPHPSFPGPQKSFHVLAVTSLINLPSINPLLICFHSDDLMSGIKVFGVLSVAFNLRLFQTTN